MRTWCLGSSLCCCLLAVACGGDSERDTGDNGNSGGVVTVRSGDRIAWDQPVESPGTARAYNYSLYVDGAKMSLSEITCGDVRTAGGVACSGRLPSIAGGRHSLELTASFGSFESGRSTPLTISIASLTFVTSSLPETSAAAPPAEPVVSCLSSLPGECYEAQVVASGLGALNAIAATRDLAFVVEEHARIRTIQKDTLATQAALVADAGTRILDLAIPPDFERTRTVYVSWSESSPNGNEVLQVTRYRELHGVLGEGATIVAGLPLPVGGSAPMAIDEAGLIYLALPSLDSASGVMPAAADLGHFILRFRGDGSLPAENPVQSPVIAQGYGRPSAVQWSQGARALWLSGSDDRSLPVVSTLNVAGGAGWPMQPVPASPLRELTEVSSLAVTRDARSGSQVWVVSQGNLLRMPVGANASRLEAIAFPGVPAVTRVAAGSDGVLFVAAQAREGQSTDVWRYRPVTPRRGR